MKLKLKETLAKILLYLLKGERRTLLWTNPNKEANYDGGTVSLDLSDYDEVDILCYAGGQIVDRLQVPVGSVGKLSEVGGTGGYNSGGITVITRLCTVTNSGVVFTSAYLGYDGQTMMQGFNHNLKPYKIYGIKVGGVLRNSVISRLAAIFTSLLFGGDVNEDLGEGDAEQVTPKRAEEDYHHGYDYINRGVGYSFKVSRQSSIWPLLHICNEPCIQTRCNIPDCDVAGRYGRYVDSESKHNGDGLCLDNRLTISERRWAA